MPKTDNDTAAGKLAEEGNFAEKATLLHRVAFFKDGIFAKDSHTGQKGESAERGDVLLPCQLQKGDTKRVTTAAPDGAANPQHDPVRVALQVGNFAEG